MSGGFEIRKVWSEVAARGIFDGLRSGEEETFHELSITQGWRTGALKALEGQFTLSRSGEAA
jgi:hypothetical protein